MEAGWSLLSGAGALLSGAGSIYAGVEQSKANKKMLNLSRDEYNFNKSLLEDDQEQERKQREAYKNVYGQRSMINL